MIKGKAPEEISRKFNIKNDFTPQEVCFIKFHLHFNDDFHCFQEEQIKKENEWCEEK